MRALRLRHKLVEVPAKKLKSGDLVIKDDGIVIEIVALALQHTDSVGDTFFIFLVFNTKGEAYEVWQVWAFAKDEGLVTTLALAS